MTAPNGPRLLVLVERGGRVESEHQVCFAVADARGTVRHGGGDVERAVFPRSAIKPQQAIALVESGGAEAFGLSEEELALACASHGGEPMHTGRVESWLKRIGLGVEALECGSHPPSYPPAAEALRRAGRAPSALHNNCSGKHAAMLTLALHLGVDPKGYVRPEHPVQRRIGAALTEVAGIDGLPPPAIDGCGIPTYPLPLRDLAIAMARLADPSDLAPARAAACRRLALAMRAFPELVAGTERPCTLIMRALPHLVVKTGAEGVYAAAWPARGLGIVLKVEDGASRASALALLAILDALGAVDSAARSTLQRIAEPVLCNHAGQIVGRIRAGALDLR